MPLARQVMNEPVTETDQLRTEVAELRAAVINIGWHLDKVRICLLNIPKGQEVNERPNLQGTFENLVWLCQRLGSIPQNTPRIEEAEWCKALLARPRAPSFEEVNRAFYAELNAAEAKRAAGG